MRLLRKIAPIAVSALMLAATVGSAAAVGVNQWKTTVTDPVIVLSSADPASNYDILAALNIANSVGVSSGTSTSTSATISGNVASLNTASEKIYLEVDTGIGVAIDTITDNELPNVLGGTVFVDDTGTEYNYVQTIKVGSRQFTLSDSGSDLDNPALVIDVGTTPTTAPLYNYTVTFTNVVNFTTADSIGEDIEFAGGIYTVGTNTDIDTLHLFGGSQTVTLDTATSPSSTVTLGGTTYTLTLDAVAEAGDKASITLSDGSSSDSDTITEGASKKLLGVTVYLKDTMSTTNDQGRATILVGANELYFENNAEVMVGSNKDDIEKTNTWFGQYTHNMSSLTISVAMQDSDLDHIAVGDKYVDPVFGSFYVYFVDAVNGPKITGDQGADENSARHKVEFKNAENACLSVTFDVDGVTKTIEFDDDGDLEDCDDHDIVIIEGQAVIEDAFTILNSGSYQMMVELTKLSSDNDSIADDDVTLTDVFTGKKYELDNVDLGDDGDSQDIVINGQTFTVYALGNSSENGIGIVSSDWGAVGDTFSTGVTVDPTATPSASPITVYPYLETINGLNHAIAFMDNVSLSPVLANGSYWAIADGTTEGFRVVLPTGSVDIFVASDVSTPYNCNITIKDTSGTTLIDGPDINETGTGLAAGAAEVSVGEMDYIFGFLDTTQNVCNITQIYIYPDADPSTAATTSANGASIPAAVAGLTAAGTEPITQPSVLYVEEDDDSDSDVKNILFVPTNDSSGYEEVCYENVTFSGGNVSTDVTFDDADYTANIDAFGTYFVKDSSDTNQELLWFTYPEQQMYADVYFAENDAVITAGSGGFTAGGWKYIKDSEVASFSNRNLIVIGGTAVNRVARRILDFAETTPVYGTSEEWQTATGVDGANKAIVKLATSPYAADKYALLVAGWEGPETQAAASWLTTGTLPATETVLYDTVNKVVI